MATLNELVTDFLAQKCIAVAGVSRSRHNAANMIYRKLRKTGYNVFSVNPKIETVEGDTCYPALKSIPEKTDGLVIVTRPEVTEQLVRQCADLEIPRVWMHVIPGACPMMFCKPVDFAHTCLCWMLKLTGGLPKPV
ncbi:MAG: CoA-binding protein [Planctomycetota bacterium]|jgi:predicted CoA-binding protein